MKKILYALPMLSLMFTPVVTQAAYTTNFENAVPGGTQGNFAPQDGWTISDPQEFLSFVQTGSAYTAGSGQSVGFGGFFAVPASQTSVSLSRTINETLRYSAFSVDFAIINSFVDADPLFDGPWYPGDDTFGFSLSDSSGEILTIDVAPTGAAGGNFRKLVVLGVDVPVNGLTASDFNTPAWYTLGMTFAANGADLDYFGTLANGSITFNGTLAGKANTVVTGLAMNFDIAGADPSLAGSNYLLVDNISIPEPTSLMSVLLAVGLLGARRRR
jgi:hypothetical protein